MACRGTGRVISNLGGSPSTVDCPWCEGSGLRAAEIDAQARWAEATPPAATDEDERADDGDDGEDGEENEDAEPAPSAPAEPTA
jgi:hypothetical protein